jgi:hypothetical protein
MEFDVVRVVEHIHGHLGWLTAAVIVHPAILLRDRERSAHLSVGLATGLLTLEWALGAWLYGPYRARLQPHIFTDARWIGVMFERKEHLAMGALLLTWAAASAYAIAIGARDEVGARMRTFAHHAFVIAAALLVVTACLGTLVASYDTF